MYTTFILLDAKVLNSNREKEEINFDPWSGVKWFFFWRQGIPSCPAEVNMKTRLASNSWRSACPSLRVLGLKAQGTMPSWGELLLKALIKQLSEKILEG